MTFTEASQLTKEQIARAFGVPAHILVDPDRPAALRTWSLCMTSENHGTVGPAGCTFSHAPEKHERVLVVEVVAAGSPPAPGVDLTGLLRITIDGTVIPLATSFSPAVASTVLTDERISALWLQSERHYDFARAIEREVAAQAGQVAVPEADAGPWQVLEMADQPDSDRLLDVVLTNGVMREGLSYSNIDWTQVADWRYSHAPSPAKESK